MKKSFASIMSLIFMISTFSQTKTFDCKPRGMEFVPQGSYEMKTTLNSETKVTKVSVAAFWMSNEITNAEYREFVEWVNNNPDNKLYQTKYSVEVVTDPKKGSMKDTVIAKQIPIEVSTFKSDMIDPLSLERVNKDYKNYFTDIKYSDYPVIGVSFKMAEYFCLWKTMMENEQMKEKGLPNVQSYRIPLETEWEYVAQLPITKEDKVSEWVNSGQGETGIVRGGSWKSGNNISERQSINPDSKEPYIGFRTVRSYMAGEK
jgi:formylglycine-generating enzyme required for sulfatase activity